LLEDHGDEQLDIRDNRDEQHRGWRNIAVVIRLRHDRHGYDWHSVDRYLGDRRVRNDAHEPECYGHVVDEGHERHRLHDHDPHLMSMC
jgi:hypothetical protein